MKMTQNVFIKFSIILNDDDAKRFLKFSSILNEDDAKRIEKTICLS